MPHARYTSALAHRGFGGDRSLMQCVHACARVFSFEAEADLKLFRIKEPPLMLPYVMRLCLSSLQMMGKWTL